MKVPNERLSGDGSAQTADTRGIRGQLPPHLYCAPKICCALDENKNFSHLKIYCSLQALKPGYVPGSAKIVSAIRIVCFEGHSAKLFFINHHWGAPESILGGSRVGAATALLEVIIC